MFQRISPWSNGVYPKAKEALAAAVKIHPGALEALPRALKTHLRDIL
jgi:hypothetical protein